MSKRLAEHVVHTAFTPFLVRPLPHWRAATFLALFLAAAGIACATTERVPDASVGPRYVVLLVHGIYGQPEHFGAMKAALAARPLSPGHRVEVHDVRYATINAAKSVDDFAASLHRDIQRVMRTGADPDDQLALIGHSQGGLVIAEWLFGGAGASWAAERDALAPQVDAVVTLATPFWGSKMANFVRAFAPSALIEDDAFHEPGAMQLSDMTFGSASISARRVQMFSRGGLKGGRARWLSVGGATGWLDAAAPFSVGRDRFEDDTAVTIPSSNPNFTAYIERVPGGGARSIALDAFDFSPATPFRVVDAIHLSPSSDLPQLSPGIAQVPRRCVSAAGACHPAFDLVVAHLSRAPLSAGELDTSMTGFMLSIDVATAGAATLTPTITLVPQGDALDVSRLVEPYADVTATRGGAEAAFTFFGAFALPKRSGAGPASVVAEIAAPGYVGRTVEIPVRAKESTYVRLYLVPILDTPLPPVGDSDAPETGAP